MPDLPSLPTMRTLRIALLFGALVALALPGTAAAAGPPFQMP